MHKKKIFSKNEKKTALGMGTLHMLPKTASKSEVPLKSYFSEQVWTNIHIYIYIYIYIYAIYIYIYIPRQFKPPRYVQTKTRSAALREFEFGTPPPPPKPPGASFGWNRMKGS